MCSPRAKGRIQTTDSNNRFFEFPTLKISEGPLPKAADTELGLEA